MAEAAQEHPLRPWCLLSPALVSVGLLLVIPACFIVVYSFWLRTATGADIPELNVGNWAEVLTDPFYRAILWQTLRIAVITTLLCAALGYVPAYFLAHTQIQQKALLVLLLMLPFWISYIIRTLSWINVLGSSGAVNVVLVSLRVLDEPLQMLYNQATVILGLAHYLLPFMILNIYVSIDGIDKNLEPAARTLGCTPWQAFREVTLPLSLPGLAAGSVLCFVLGAGTYITPLILGGPGDAMFANLIYEAIIIQLNWPLGSALSVVLLVLLGSVVLLYNRFLGLSQIYKSFG
ncbi:MAG: ABC transporter permease [Gammaproteobacteria bacterium]|nr:ABC transporter permease [Gammaproteobacteria bacterium]NIR84601.1 ABC transporter permease [Gammaproteobacteria bacterium]NIR90504.1 ABC transporter permease [Gammaproteobacteria bacterium]NIU05652.1 ABC transporter permease [Gammaproteobacteria bacterium]NIV52791.1 ABC transporter permease subunit [Gammaproteobacteria bacterium]